MKPSITALLFLGLALGACRKSSTPEPQPVVTNPAATPPTSTVPATQSTITGTVIPALGASSVTIVSGNNTYNAEVDAKTGKFSIALPPGNYDIKVQPATGFVAPAVKTAKLALGETIAANDLALSPEGTAKVFQLYVSGVLRKGTLISTYVAGRLQLSNVETIKQNAGTPEQKTDQYTLEMDLLELTNPGTFVCNTIGARLKYNRAVPSTGSIPPSGNIWLAWEGAGTDTKITITQIDATSRSISGYFSGSLASTIAGQSDLPAQCVFRIAY